MNITTLAVGGDVPLELVDGKAPTEIRLLRRGKNPSTKGDWIFDEEAAAQVMATYREMGRDWVIGDYDHGSLQQNPIDPGRSSRAAGRGQLELRDGDLWVVDVKWTPEAQAAIEAGEWPSVSPAFAHDDQGRPTWLINFGLTGNPSLHKPADLMAANVLLAALAAVGAERTMVELGAVAFEEHSLIEEPWDGTAADLRIRQWASSDGSGDKDTIDWAKYERGFAWVDPAQRKSFGGYKLAHHDVVNGRLVDSKRGIQAVAAVLQGGRGGVDLPAADRAAVERHIARHYDQWGEQAPWQREQAPAIAATKERCNMMKTPAEVAAFFGISEEQAKMMLDHMAEMMSGKKADGAMMSAVALAIGADVSAKPEALLARASALNAFAADVQRMTGEKSWQAALGAVEGLLKTKILADEQAKTIEALNAKTRASEITAILSDGKAKAKITVAEHDDRGEHSLYATAMSKGEHGAAWLSANVAQRATITALSVDHKQPEKGAKTDGPEAKTDLSGRTWEALSNQERVSLHASDRRAYDALRNDWIQRGRPAKAA